MRLLRLWSRRSAAGRGVTECRRHIGVALLVASLLIGSHASAAVKLPAIFAHHMVLQRDAPVPIWGWAEPGEEVTVAIADQSKTVTAGADRKWLIQLDKLAAGGPHTLTVKGKNKLTVNDVMIGEVWLASGQSNMVHIMPTTTDFAKEQPLANYPGLRIFTVARAVSQTPKEDCHGNWLVLSPTTVDDVAAVPYYFGRELHQKLGVPVGVITSALGSTPVEAWTSLDAQQDRTELQELLASWERKSAEFDPVAAKTAYEKELAAWKEAAEKAKAEKKPVPREPKVPIAPREQPAHPGVMFNGMIAPLVPYSMRGVICYQGEFNAQTEDYARLYRHQLPLLIRDWRTRWQNDQLPFASVQLPNFETSSRSPQLTGWRLVREGQLQSLAVPRTGMIVSTDIGEATGIHPRNKRAFGERLALWARAEVYGERIPWSGPIYSGFKVTGNTIELTFRHTDGGLTFNGDERKGFLICGADQQWRPGSARIQGVHVLVSSQDVATPVAVRYSWADNPDGNLTNAVGLPASPFRTDND